MNEECYSCGVKFEIEFAEEFDSAELQFCPACGENLDPSLDFSEDDIDFEGYPA